MALELTFAVGVGELQPFLSADEQNFLLCRIDDGARQLNALGGSLAAHVAVDVDHARR